jgi:hypothetical protein
MTLPFSLGTITLPDWLPAWVPVVLLLPVVLWLLLLIVMPFAVLGLRGRLEGIEAQLDDLHAETRGLAMRLGAPLPPLPEPRREERLGSVSMPPPGPARARRERSEPRIDWPRGADD